MVVILVLVVGSHSVITAMIVVHYVVSVDKTVTGDVFWVLQSSSPPNKCKK